MKIVVIGGTGLIGKKVVMNLRHQGHEAVAASPSSGVNTVTCEGLAQALAGAKEARQNKLTTFSSGAAESDSSSRRETWPASA